MWRMQQLQLLSELQPAKIDLGQGCVAWLQTGFAPDHGALLTRLEQELPWMQEIYPRGGRFVPAPRLTSYHGDPCASYVYSGIRHQPAAWTDTLTELRASVGARIGTAVNAVLANLYRGGQDGMGYHADDEPELGPRRDDIVVACVSLGDTRRFVFKQRRGTERRVVDLPGGSLLLMRGHTQRDWLHALPKTRRPSGVRLSLTFRVVAG